MAAGDSLHCEAHPEAPAEAACVVCERLLCGACRHIDAQGLSVCPVHADRRGALAPAEAIPLLLATALESTGPMGANAPKTNGAAKPAVAAQPAEADGTAEADGNATADAAQLPAPPARGGEAVADPGNLSPAAEPVSPSVNLAKAPESEPAQAPPEARAPEPVPPEPVPPEPDSRADARRAPRPTAASDDDQDDRWPFAAVPDPRAQRPAHSAQAPNRGAERGPRAEVRRRDAETRATNSGRSAPRPDEGAATPAATAEAARIADLACPWEGDSDLGDVAAFARTAALALGAPMRFPALQNWQRGDLVAPMLFAMLCVGVGAALTALAGVLGFGPGATVGFPEGMPPQLAALPELPLAVYELLFLPMLPLFSAVSLALHAGVAHLLLRAVGATRGPFERTLRVVCYAQVAHLVGWLPSVGPHAETFYLVFLIFGGVRGAHQAGWFPGLLVLLPLLVTRLPFVGL
jgi:hypothetical protein